MKISEVSIENIKNYLRINTNSDDVIIDAILVASKSYLISYTGLTVEVLDTKEDITIALMVLCSDLYENRAMTVQNDKVNKVVQSILDMHCINLL